MLNLHFLGSLRAWTWMDIGCGWLCRSVNGCELRLVHSAHLLLATLSCANVDEWLKIIRLKGQSRKSRDELGNFGLDLTCCEHVMWRPWPLFVRSDVPPQYYNLNSQHVVQNLPRTPIFLPSENIVFSDDLTIIFRIGKYQVSANGTHTTPWSASDNSI